MENFLNLPAGDLGVLALGVVIAGTVGGLGSGVLGIGGGVVLVPVLCHVMSELGVGQDVRIHLAIGTSLAATIPAVLARAHTRRNDIDWSIVQRWAAPIVLGAVAGILLFALLGERALVLLFAAVALPLATTLAIPRRKRETPAPLTPSSQMLLPAVVGSTSAATGMGGDATGSTVLQRLGMFPPQAIPTAAVLALAVAVPAVFGAVLLGWNNPDLPPGSYGYLNLYGFALTAPLLVGAETAGAWLAHMVDLSRFRLVFAALIVLATARMLWDVWG